ncbi:hypothetical protein J1N35_017625 [Gossypium stocksii]|uniref:Uncharacterized protein n=1 Tax=Gossypium stocksii TaxID=47602 RepID=A0A9D4A5X0_9ROSI|nr:hypothetical protein J1N35_017625 [Gossypium stocksii]
MDGIHRKLGFLNGIDVGSFGFRGGFSIGWNLRIDIRLWSYLQQDIEKDVLDDDGGMPWRSTDFYRSPDEQSPSASWDLLRQLSSQSTGRWLVARDFNEIAYSFGIFGGQVQDERQMVAFRQVWDDCNLVYTGLDPDDTVLGKITEVKLALNLESDKQELYWEQKAHANWMKNGDPNTGFPFLYKG